MQVKAVAKYIRVQPRKVRIIADECRGKTADFASQLLRFHPSKSAHLLRKVLESAIANAAENHGVSRDELKISGIMVDEGPSMKRITQRSMGRANRILKKTSHITVTLEDYEARPAIKPHGTKAKPRPTFATPVKKGKKPATKAEEAPVEPTEEVLTEEVVSETPVAETATTEPKAKATSKEEKEEVVAEEPEAEAKGVKPEVETAPTEEVVAEAPAEATEEKES